MPPPGPTRSLTTPGPPDLLQTNDAVIKAFVQLQAAASKGDKAAFTKAREAIIRGLIIT